MMKKFLILLAMLVAVAVLADSVVAAEAGAKPAAATMEEVDLDEAAADMEDEDYDDEDGGITLDFVINAIPAALLIDMSGNNFGLESAEGRSTASSVYMMPNISVGIGADVNEKVYLDALLGVGVVVNESLRSFFAQATVSATFAASQSLNIGPRIGLIQFMGTEWLDDEALLDEVDFDDSTGLMLGLQIVMGDRIRYLVNIDYITMDFDADLPAGVTADNNGTLEVEGLAVQFGVRGEF
ncbi:MAG: hypothetical protein HN919_15240 [Verrucomicrobia bacterium]|jgi:hypothetical protein|nr:hypothetical protein [Verrucomicrobiota bacterium]MBT7067654.1 hypothetical protein [Verrucomicrobiota bacterium]MBT7701444.1 hypothetical protein [Verrucomicrobiota bacterium]